MNGHYKYVCLFGLDGMGNFNKNTDTPNLDRIFGNYAQTFYGYSMDPTISAENWGGMLLGALPVVHGLTNSIVSRKEYNNKSLPSVFKRIREVYPDDYLASYVNWNPINIGIIENDIGVDKQTADNDELLTEKIVKAVDDKPLFMFIQFDDIDGAGHHFGYGTEDFLSQIRKSDLLIGKVFDAYCEAGIIDETLFMAISDHGGYIRSHGGYSDGEKYIYFAARGNGISKGEIGYMQTKDTAATVLYALGIDLPEQDISGFSSKIPSGIFEGVGMDYIMPEKLPSYPVHSDTPAFQSDAGLTSFFDVNKIALCMFFDNNLIDETGKITAVEHNRVKYYSDGVRGARGEIGLTGFADLQNLSVGDKSFSVSFWHKIDRSIDRDPVVLANKTWNRDRSASGVVFSVRSNDSLINLGCGTDDFDIVTPFPENVSDGWVHITGVIDKEIRQVRVYHDFELAHVVSLDERYLSSLDNGTFVLGEDTDYIMNTENLKQIVNIDDLIVFSYALSDYDILKLKNYYSN